MIRFNYEGTDTDRDISAEMQTVASVAADIAGWSSGVSIHVTQTSATTWTVTAQGETVTAEVIDA